MENLNRAAELIESMRASLRFISFVRDQLISLQQLSTPDGSDHNKPGPLPASKASIDALPRITVTDLNCAVVKECAICLEEIDLAVGGGGGDTREMPCKHGFHSSCIEKWLQIHGSCPICRFLMPADEDGGGVGDGDGDGGENGRRQRSDDDDDDDDDVGDGSENGRRQRMRLIIIIPPDESPSLSEWDSDSGSGSGEIE